MERQVLIPTTLALACLGSAGLVMAQTTLQTTQQLPAVVVTATRIEALAFDVPASISRIGADEIKEGHALVNISESLGAVPGLLARDRQNYAQDVQISVRGFGARSTFGIRGVRLYVDGIPATLPDGQGQISHVELGSVARIEVLRGPFSALYGNSAGGVIQVFTEDGQGPATLSTGMAAGSDGLQRIGTQLAGSNGGLGYSLSASRLRTDGFRDHSTTERSLGNAKLSWRVDGDSKFTVVANSVGLPTAQDPLGLTRAQFTAKPRGVDQAALDYNTRKTVNQTQVGGMFEHRINEQHSVSVMAYSGHRGTAQFQSIPKAAQAGPLSPGGVIRLGRNYSGVDVRWTGRWQDLSIVGGLAYDGLSEHRQGFQNFIGGNLGAGLGSGLGVLGSLRRDEHNRVASTDPYVQAAWTLTPAFTVNVGARHSKVAFKSTDGYVVGINPDDSGRATYSATLPVLGALYALSKEVHLYATAGRGFETPTLNELAYRSGGLTGLNFGLQAAKSNSVEAGVKAQRPGWGELTAAAFRTGTTSEIVTQTNSGGRATFQNAGATKRTGIELGWSAALATDWRAQAAATLLNARYQDGFLTCTATPCAAANVLIPAGKRIPGIARGSLFAGLKWAPPTGWRAGFEAKYLSSVMVNDANTDAAPRYTVAAAHVGYLLTAGRWDFNGFVRADNLFDRRYAGSVIVNEGNGRFFEPAPGRSWLASANVSVRF